jgi:excisionase family DNA binding protein
MGSGFYSVKEAALRLQKSERTIYTLIKEGRIRKRTVDGRVQLEKEDVDLVAVDLGEDSPPLNRKTFFQLESKVRKLQDQVRALMAALEMRSEPPMRPDPAACASIIQAVQQCLYVENREEIWTEPFVEKWAALLERIDEITFEAITHTANDQQAWVPFFRFCSELADFCWENDRKVPSLAWQALAGRLETARKDMRASVVTWVEMGRGTIPQHVLDALGSHREVLRARLAKGGGA